MKVQIFNNGKNKGKKYTRKKDIDSLYAEKAEDFNTWFLNNHENIKLYLEDIKSYDSDSFNDCYLKIYDIVLYSGVDINNYRYYFIQSYLSILLNSKIKENRYCEFLPIHEKEEDNKHLDIEDKQRALEKDILNYVYLNHSIRNFELFKMYMSLKPAVNYSSLSKITGVKSYTIQRVISKIKKDIRNNEEFRKRRDKL